MPGLLERFTGIFDPRTVAPPPPRDRRVYWQNEETEELEAYGVDLLGQTRGSALSRRLNSDNHTVAASYAAVFAAIRFREQAVTRPQIVLEERVGGKWGEVGTLDEPSEHPLLNLLRRPNRATTARQLRGGIERGKLTNGDHYLIKRRDGLRTPREFEIWNGARVRAIARKDRPWEPDYFEYRPPDATERVVQVGPEDVVWLRHIVDPRDPMRSLTPIGAIRVQAHNATEAQRMQMRYYDDGIHVGGVLVPTEGSLGPNERKRITEQINDEWSGTDASHRWRLLDEGLKLLSDPQSNVDLQFVEQLRWGVIEVARAFEVSPITLKDFEKATYTNADQAGSQDWEVVRNQVDTTLEELNLWLVEPDFGKDYRLVARYAGIGALQDSMKVAAEVDDIKLKGGRVTINELRARDGQPPVEWGDIPIMPSNMLPLGSQMAQPQGGGGGGGGGQPGGGAPDVDPDAQSEQTEPQSQDPEVRAALREVLAIIERTVPEGHRRRIKNEARKAFARV